MTSGITELYDALIDVGSAPEKARAASEAVADFDRKIGDLAVRVASIDGKLTIILAVLGVMSAGLLSLIGKAFFVS